MTLGWLSYRLKHKYYPAKRGKCPRASKYIFYNGTFLAWIRKFPQSDSARYFSTGSSSVRKFSRLGRNVFIVIKNTFRGRSLVIFARICLNLPIWHFPVFVSLFRDFPCFWWLHATMGGIFFIFSPNKNRTKRASNGIEQKPNSLISSRLCPRGGRRYIRNRWCLGIRGSLAYVWRPRWKHQYRGR